MSGGVVCFGVAVLAISVVAGAVAGWFAGRAGARAVVTRTTAGTDEPPDDWPASGAGGTSDWRDAAIAGAMNRAREEALKIRDASNLSQIAKGANAYLLKFGNNESYPLSMQEIYERGITPEPKLYLKPGSSTEVKAGKFATDYDCILDRVGKKVSESDATPDVPMAWDKVSFPDSGRNVVFFDSHVEYMLPGQFEELMKKTEAWVKAMQEKK